jgi:hypothetical protein
VIDFGSFRLERCTTQSTLPLLEFKQRSELLTISDNGTRLILDLCRSDDWALEIR